MTIRDELRATILRWCRPLHVESDDEQIDARVSALSDLLDENDEQLINDLAQLMIGAGRHMSTSSLTRITSPLSEHDPQFDTSARRELELLSGAMLTATMAGHSDIAPYAALAVSSATLGGARQTTLPIDIAADAEVHIDRLANETRQRPELSSLALPAFPKDKFEAIPAKAKEQQNLPGITAALELLTGAANTAFARSARA